MLRQIGNGIGGAKSDRNKVHKYALLEASSDSFAANGKQSTRNETQRNTAPLDLSDEQIGAVRAVI